MRTVRAMDVAIFIMDGVADFGLAAVREVMDTANSLRDELDRPPPPWKVRLTSLGHRVRSGCGYSLTTTPVARLAGQVDLVIVPAVNVLQADDLIELVSCSATRQFLDLVAAMHVGGANLAAACTGTFFLAEAGVLDGTVATTSWWLGPAFRRRYPNVTLKVERTLCREDHVTTAGAAVAHLDLALSLVNTHSPALAELVARYMMIGNRNTQRDFIVPEVIARGDPLVAAFERWVREHLADRFRIATAARALGVAERTLQRATASELGMSPRDFVDRIRLEQATRLLRESALSTDTVAARVGYLHGATLRNLIRRRRGMSISEIRANRPFR